MEAARHIAEGTIGAHVSECGVSYCMWAPDTRRACALIEKGGVRRAVAMNAEADGYWSATDFEGSSGDLYRFELDGTALPDVASRFQPKGVDGPSECIDPSAYAWACGSWQRPPWHGQTTYEIHVGTLTPEGTFSSAASKMSRIRDLGVEAIEIMPVADFAGNRGWGYDGVSLFAPARCYGRPDELRALVDSAHGCGMAVILDVVYNHVGPQGGSFDRYSADYFRSDKETPWGHGFNLDGRRSGPVRGFLMANVACWLDDFRIDGLRLDATHAIADTSPVHIIAQIAELAHSRGAFVIAEDERNMNAVLRSKDEGGFGVDAAWADDFHHQVRVALTGIQTSYFSGYEGKASGIAETIQNGWFYRGQAYRPWSGKPRGEPSDFLPPESFIYCIENHDQVGNRPLGERLAQLVDPARFRAASMLLCLNPHPALIFMGQEWAASTPFLYFCNHGGDLGRNISRGRQNELGASELKGGPVTPDPEDPASFEVSKIRWEESTSGGHLGALKLYRCCLRERRALRNSGAFARQSWRVHSEGPLVAVLYENPAVKSLLLVNLGDRSLFPESLPGSLSPGPGNAWQVVLNSEAPEFGGMAPEVVGSWALHGPGALWLEAKTKDADAAH
jgi:maltooligosyltrehalose trehalohydrolase